jgi:hypothetical protein
MTYESQSAQALTDYALPVRYLPPALRGGFARWLERHGYTLLATMPTGPDAAVVLVDRTSEATADRPGFDRYVTWRVYAGQAEPELGYYSRDYASAVQDFLSRGGVGGGLR